MNTLDTLYFPDTVLPARHQLTLALFFSVTHLLQPVEQEENADRDDASATVDYPFMETEFCQVHTPAPLGADRDRFLHLLHDIESRKDNYVEQLSYLSLAALSAPAAGEETSRQAIHSSLLHDIDRDGERGREQERQALWQARLVLKIAEILDREEDELARQLAAVDDREIALFRRLQGEIRESGEEDAAGDDPFAELLELRQKMNTPRPGMVANRLRAWNRLYQAGPLPARPLVWTTSRQEAADILFEQYEKECGHQPLPLLQLELPAGLSPDQADIREKVAQFRAEMQPQLQKLAAALEVVAGAEKGQDSELALLLPQAPAWQKQWNDRMEALFPARHYGRITLAISLFRAMSLPELVGKGRDRNSALLSSNLLLAVCR